MTADAHPVPTHGRFAPDPVLLARAVHEKPATARVAATPQSVALLGQRQRGRQEIVGDSVPALRRRPNGAIRVEPVVDPIELAIHRFAPADAIEGRVVSQRADRVADRAQPGELAEGGRLARVRDRVGRQELDGSFRGIEMVMWRFAVPGPSTVMGAGAMKAVGQRQGRVSPELPCNGIHRP